MPRESWELSRGLRAVTAAYGLIYPCLLYVMMRFFFPRVFLMSVMVMAGVLYVALCFARFRVVLDRADGEDAASRGAASRRKAPLAGFACGAGLLSLAVAAVVQPQAGGWLAHSVALLLRIYFGACGVVAVLIGTCLLLSAWRDRRTARQHRYG